ncbi:ATP-binding protein [Spirochaeta cellobiosiphila]|uniref:ATP-binding protein n=1 Tax=Spirochaeta cellobiosiphila TaxID=504483 RepID=UPI0003FE7BEB|nr:AAA family ATPase [Spirochaeta cellobiosiphila]
MKTEDFQRPSAELLYKKELDQLYELDRNNPKPEGWLLSPQGVCDFILGNRKYKIEPKFVGSRSFIECCIVAMATNRGLMLIGEPGTAKSYLSELICAAISGDSTLTIQGSAGTTDDQIKYSWNYALLLAEGPSEKALVPAPLYRGIKEGKIVRFEEITRCPQEIQDSLLSVLSDRVLSIPELPTGSNTLYAKKGFNIIGTANIRDKGVNEMSSALKRRFNFETVHPVRDIKQEMELVQRETNKMLANSGISVVIPPDKTEILVTLFHELRNGKTIEGGALEPLSTVMSLAEAVSVNYAAGLHAYYYNNGKVEAEHFVSNLLGSAIKDSKEDQKKMGHYFHHIVGKRNKTWKEFYQARHNLGLS